MQLNKDRMLRFTHKVKFVRVEPLKQPLGKIFYIPFRYKAKAK